MIDTTDNTVTVCMDYIKSRCSREKCKYFHPPAHLQAKIKSSQQQVSQAAQAAQAAAVVRWSLTVTVCLSGCLSVCQCIGISACFEVDLDKIDIDRVSPRIRIAVNQTLRFLIS